MDLYAAQDNSLQGQVGIPALTGWGWPFPPQLHTVAGHCLGLCEPY